MSSSTSKTPTPPESAHAPFGGATLWTGWAAAACFALATAYFGAHYFAVRGQLTLATTDADFARTESQALAHRLEAERILSSGYITQLQKAADVSNLKIIRLADPSMHAAPSLAVVIWNPDKHEGLLSIEKLPDLPADQNYQLWLTASNGSEPVNAAVFTANAAGTARVSFQLAQDLAVTVATLTREPKGGSVKPTGPVIATGTL